MKSIGIYESALAWIASYLSDRTLAVKIEDAISRRQQLYCGVPQGTVLGPLLFTIYCMPLTATFARHHLKYHMYADDTQLYVDFPRNQLCDADIATRRIEACANDIKRWMTSHQLLLNETKTETIVVYARNVRVPPAITTADECHITRQPTVRDIGIFLDSGMDMLMQVAPTCQAAYFQLHNIAKIRHYLTIDACKTIVHGLVTSKLDYGNAVLYGINGPLLQKLQRVQNSAARVITQQRRREHLHIKPVLIALYWLPVACITYNILVLTFRAMHDLAPEYIADIITEYTPDRQLRSAGSLLLRVPRHNLERYAIGMYFRNASDDHLPAARICASDSPRKAAAVAAPMRKL
ncbi:hypothetical protein NP493_69g05016 [Ridgeia piscesae]|uniref:Reverse transcriptase domain-containing protein n=1 Tax=Ridgeia piscesae TaxID=27915 RepID=A0AAD9PA58_RIDPI|nr:hypothetical protein NP493_69g05016 [Ridgeia piscesae]